MAHITNCPKCGRCYEETSEEEANAPSRRCSTCWHEQHTADERRAVDEAYALVGKLRDEVEELDGDDHSAEADLTRSRYYAAIDAYDAAILRAARPKIVHAFGPPPGLPPDVVARHTLPNGAFSQLSYDQERMMRQPTPISPELIAYADAARARVDAFTKGMGIPADLLRGTASTMRPGWGESLLARMMPILRAMRNAEAPIEPMPAPPSRTPILDSLLEEHRNELLRVGAMCGDGPLDVEHALRQLKQATEKPLAGEELKAVLDYLNPIPEGTMTHYDQTKQTIADANGYIGHAQQKNETDDRLIAELSAMRALLGQIALNMAAIADRLEAAAALERSHG